MMASMLTVPPRHKAEDLTYSLSPVESVRVIAFLDEAVEKLEFLNTLTPDVLAHRDELAALVGDEITTLIQEQKALEKEFEVLVQQQHAMKNTSNPTEIKNINKKIAEVAKLLQDKTKDLCKNLRDSPNISANIEKIKAERDSLRKLLLQTTRDLTEFLYPSLGKGVANDKEQSDKLAMAEENEKKAAAEIAGMQAQLKKKREDNEKLKQQLQNSIAEKREELKMLRATRFEEQARQPMTEAKLESLKRVIEEEEEEWATKNKLLQDKLDLERQVHAEFYAYLQEKGKEMKELMTKWLLKSEKDTEEINFKFNSVTTKIAATEKVLDEVSSRELTKRIEMEEREEQKKRDAEAKDLQKKQNEARQKVAVLQIQHWLWTKKYDDMKKKKKKKKGLLERKERVIYYHLRQEEEVSGTCGRGVASFHVASRIDRVYSFTLHFFCSVSKGPVPPTPSLVNSAGLFKAKEKITI